MSTLQDLNAKHAAAELIVAGLVEQIAAVKASEKQAAIEVMLEQILIHNVSTQDLFPGAQITSANRSTLKKGEAKYRDPATGITWSGRGRCPAWIVGKDKTTFLIVATPATVALPTGDASSTGAPSNVTENVEGSAPVADNQADAIALATGNPQLSTDFQLAGTGSGSCNDPADTVGAELTALAAHAPGSSD